MKSIIYLKVSSIENYRIYKKFIENEGNEFELCKLLLTHKLFISLILRGD